MIFIVTLECKDVCIVTLECKDVCIVTLECKDVYIVTLECKDVCIVTLECKDVYIVTLECKDVCIVTLECKDVCIVMIRDNSMHASIDKNTRILYWECTRHYTRQFVISLIISNNTARKATIQKVTTMIATFKNVLFPGDNHHANHRC